MSHLGAQISALVDGELTGAELDRANAHLATCELCRTEAAGLRQLKRQLRALAAVGDETDALAWARDDEALTRRLLAMAGPGGPVPSRRLRREQYWRERSRAMPRTGRPAREALGALRRHSRHVLWSAVSLVVVGVGAAAFSMGGSSAEPGPKVTPQLEMFSVEHAVTFGDVPFPEPTPVPSGATSP